MKVKALTAVLMPDGCWRLAKIINKGEGPLVAPNQDGGYVGTRRGGHRGRAHRMMYEAIVGSIPYSMTIDHLCKNPACIHPGHMDVVTRGENARRGRSHNGHKTHCKRGHPFTEGNYSIKMGKSGPQRRCKLCRRIAAPAGMVRPRAVN